MQCLSLSFVCSALWGSKEVWFPASATVFFVPFVIYLIFGFITPTFISHYKPEVDRQTCTCSCYDTVNRGPFEEQPSNFHHIYWNSTGASLAIFIVVVIHIILFYKIIERVFLVWCKGTIRRSMLLLILSDLYPVMYAWNNIYIYLNTTTPHQFLQTQIFFCVTEWLIIFMDLHLLDREIPTTFVKLNLIIVMGCVHLLVAGFDQLLISLFTGSNAASQMIVRNTFLLSPDFLHVLLCLWLLSREAKSQGFTLKNYYCNLRRGPITLLIIFFLTIVIRTEPWRSSAGPGDHTLSNLDNRPAVHVHGRRE